MINLSSRSQKQALLKVTERQTAASCVKWESWNHNVKCMYINTTAVAISHMYTMLWCCVLIKCFESRDKKKHTKKTTKVTDQFLRVSGLIIIQSARKWRNNFFFHKKQKNKTVVAIETEGHFFQLWMECEFVMDQTSIVNVNMIHKLTWTHSTLTTNVNTRNSTIICMILSACITWFL